MQNRYVGDVGDFGKFGLLRHVASTGLAIGVNWYLTPDQTHNNDGKHIGYLTNDTFKGPDDDLLKCLHKIVCCQQRNVSTLEQAGLLRDCSYWREPLLLPRTAATGFRKEWHEAAMQALQHCDIVFLDPDNGILPPSVSQNAEASIKYVTVDELADYYSAGKSVIVYNHRSRQRENTYLDRFRKLKAAQVFSGSHWAGLKFTRGTVRDYFFIIKPQHVEPVESAIRALLAGGWNKHFSRLPI